MNDLTIQTSTNEYTITIGDGIRKHVKDYFNKDYSKLFIITDEHVGELYLEDVLQNLDSYPVVSHILPPGEKAKSMEQYKELQTIAIENKLDRNSLIIALGGGVVGDLAGFVAATFMRGIDFIQMPTTILAHDSSVGGKVAINHPLGKNLIGSFYPPAAVLYDTSTLKSLSETEIRSGYAELIKEGLIADANLFEAIMNIDLTSLPTETLQKHILAGIKVKAEIVEADEKELGIRSYLNLGHTFAHALEAELGYGSITHGEAVATGLLFSFHVSEGVFTNELPFEQLKKWLQLNHYPVAETPFKTESILNKMKADKKATKQKIKMVLLENPQHLTNVELSDQTISHYLETFKERLMQ